jgi:hypothetical protein
MASHYSTKNLLYLHDAAMSLPGNKPEAEITPVSIFIPLPCIATKP